MPEAFDKWHYSCSYRLSVCQKLSAKTPKTHRVPLTYIDVGTAEMLPPRTLCACASGYANPHVCINDGEHLPEIENSRYGKAPSGGWNEYDRENAPSGVESCIYHGDLPSYIRGGAGPWQLSPFSPRSTIRGRKDPISCKSWISSRNSRKSASRKPPSL